MLRELQLFNATAAFTNPNSDMESNKGEINEMAKILLSALDSLSQRVFQY